MRIGPYTFPFWAKFVPRYLGPATVTEDEYEQAFRGLYGRDCQLLAYKLDHQAARLADFETILASRPTSEVCHSTPAGDDPKGAWFVNQVVMADYCVVTPATIEGVMAGNPFDSLPARLCRLVVRVAEVLYNEQISVFNMPFCRTDCRCRQHPPTIMQGK